MTDEPTSSQITDGASALLLLLSRPDLNDAQKQVASELCGTVEDWGLFTGLASRKFSLPWVSHHLSQIGFQIPDQEIATAAQSAARQMIMGTLQVTGAQAAFHKACILPLGVDHLYMKGPTLAARYHSKPALRFCRDVDLLVSENDYEAVVRRAFDEGYLLWNDPIETPCVPSERDIRAVLKYADAVAVTSPEGVLFEIHREVDKHSGFFRTQDLLASTEPLETGGQSLNVLNTPALLTYICYHHTRHTWSRLHWLADLDAIRTHPTYDHNATMSYARKCGLDELVEACLKFCELTADPDRANHVDRSSREAQILDLCKQNLDGDLALEYSIRSNFGLLGLPFDWMVRPTMKWQIRMRHVLTRLQPNFSQYHSWPLPGGLQWLYYFTRPLASIRRRLLGERG